VCPSDAPTSDGRTTPSSQKGRAVARRSVSLNTRGKNRFVLLCVAPAIILYVLFMVVPTFDVFRMSLYNWTGVGGTPTFAGFDNFVALAGDMQFVRAFQNTVFLLVVVSIVTMAGGLVLAGVMTQGKVRARNLYRFVLYLPSVLSIVVVAAIFSAVYDQQNGLINGSLTFLGLESLSQVWLGDQKIIMYSIAFAMVWQSLGYYLVLYMSGMSNIPAEIYSTAQARSGSSSTSRCRSSGRRSAPR
jgi:N-acetylglucosamine transport system permease protein